MTATPHITPPVESLELEARQHASLRREALRLNDRYLTEVVLGYGLCPWAERTLREGRTRREVIFHRDPPAGAAFAFIDGLETEATGVDIAFIIYPRLLLGSGAFDGYTERLRRADRERRASHRPPGFLMAAFHPFGAEQFTTRHQMISFIRRTPDPTIQLVRCELLEQVRAGRRDVSDEVAHQNHAAVITRGSDDLDALLRDIRRDRDHSYRRIRDPERVPLPPR